MLSLVSDVTTANHTQHIDTLLGIHYWDDNGGPPDGSDALFEVAELPPEQFSSLNLATQRGTYLDGYDAALHLLIVE